MKTITKHFKSFIIFCLIANTKLSLAQSPCATNFTAVAGSSGSYTFYCNAPTSSSINPTFFNWSFGNGLSTVNAFNTQASTIYTANGTYIVTLMSSNSALSCTTTITQTIMVSNVTSTPCSIFASFTYTQGSSGSVFFTSISTGVTPSTNYFWDFGDFSYGTGSSTSHNYYNGTYTVTLMMSDSSGIQTCVANSGQVITVNSNTCNFNVNFNYTYGSDGVVFFNSTSTGTNSNTTFLWNFGDFSGGSNGASTSYNYSSNGLYTVLLTRVDSTGFLPCITHYTQTIVVTTNTCNLNANFASATGAGNSVNFYNTSIGTDSSTVYNWNFGDGNSSTSPNPTHTYLNSGTYNVLLNIYDQNNNLTCNDSIYQTVSVGNQPCVANANFSLTPTNTPQVWNVFPANPTNVVGATWNWGDGSTSNTLYTSHTYSAAGMYNICLTVTVSCGAIDTACVSYSIYKIAGTAQDMSIIQLTVVDLSSVSIKNTTTETIDYSISPNPNNGLFDLNVKGVKSKNVNVAVYNVVGKIVYETFGETNNGNFVKDIQLNEMPNGIYFIKVSVDNHVSTKKIIINK
jgi:PKD repeat protein